MSTQQEDEVGILARAVSRMSEELAECTLERLRYKHALERIESDVYGANPKSHWAIAHEALTP